MALMISCREVTELLTEHAEGSLRGMKKLQVRIHLGICPGCQCFRDQLGATQGALRAMPEPEASNELKEKLLEELRKRGS